MTKVHKGLRKGLKDIVWYKEIYCDLLYPMWFKKFILRLVRPVVTWVQNFKKEINLGVGRYETPPLNVTLSGVISYLTLRLFIILQDNNILQLL